MINEVYNCDCLQFMKTLPDKYFELAIVDPPYGIQKKELTGYKKNNGKTFQGNLWIDHAKKCKEWDLRPKSNYFRELFRISKNQIIWGMQYFISDLKDCSQIIVWNKLTGNNFFADGELAWCSIKGTCRIFNHQWCGAFKDSERQNKAIHVNQKPISLYRWLLTNYAKEGDKIFDSHVGSGSSRIAAYELGYYYEGCELDRDYWEAQEKRFKLEKAKIDNKFYLPEDEKNLFNT